jgi:hypothetical protein
MIRNSQIGIFYCILQLVLWPSMEYTAERLSVYTWAVLWGHSAHLQPSRNSLIRKSDMILKEWSEALDVYKAASARWRRSLKAILTLHKVKSYWYVWAALLFFLLSVVSIAFYPIPNKVNPQWWTALSLWLTGILAALCGYGAVEKALAKEFALDFGIHGISHYPFWSRRTYFGYVLFLDELKDRKYSHKKVEELSSFAEIATPPKAQQARLTQNPLFTTLVAVLIALVVNSIINSSPWQNGTKAPILNLGIMLLGIVIVGHSFWSPIANRAKNQHQIIQRFLKWAARDLKEEQFS